MNVLIMITGQAPHAPGGLSNHSAERPCCAHPDPFAADLADGRLSLTRIHK